MRRAGPLLLLLVLGAVTGCGGDAAAQRSALPSAPSERPALLRAPRQPGEVIVAGETSPKTAGPFAFRGRYRVAFQQYAPEASDTDFGAQTAFVVDLERSQGIPSIHLFQAARRSGRRTLSLDARLYVDVSFGDFPFVVRFTPVRR
jgi:hypothetical protein